MDDQNKAPTQEQVEKHLLSIPNKWHNIIDVLVFGIEMEFKRQLASRDSEVERLRAEKASDLRSFNEASKFATEMIAAKDKRISDLEKELNNSGESLVLLDRLLHESVKQRDVAWKEKGQLVIQVKVLEQQVKQITDALVAVAYSNDIVYAVQIAQQAIKPADEKGRP